MIVSPTHGTFYAKIDIDDLERVRQYHWCVAKSMNKKTNTEPHYYVQTSEIKGTHCLLHRFIMNAPKGLIVDHFDRDTMNYRKENLNITTQQKNLSNSKNFSTNTSGRKGVCRYIYPSGAKMWKTSIWANNRQIHIGYYKKFEDAVKAREKAEEKYFGSYGNENNNWEVSNN